MIALFSFVFSGMSAPGILIGAYSIVGDFEIKPNSGYTRNSVNALAKLLS